MGRHRGKGGYDGCLREKDVARKERDVPPDKVWDVLEEKADMTVVEERRTWLEKKGKGAAGLERLAYLEGVGHNGRAVPGFQIML